MARLVPLILSTLALSVALHPLAHAEDPPTSWVDKDTAHPVTRPPTEPNSPPAHPRPPAPTPPPPADAAPGTPTYFRNAVHTIVVGHKTNSVFFTKFDPDSKLSTVYKADLYTSEVTKLATLPPRAGIATVNADETLAAGTYNEHESDSAQDFGRNAPPPSTPNGKPQTHPGFLVQADNKGHMMERRLPARIPLVLFTIHLQ